MTAHIRTAEPPRRGRLRLLAATATVLFATVLLLGSGAPAHAHTELLGSSPSAGVTDRAVSQVRLQFVEPLAEGLAQVVVTGPSGLVTAGDPVITGADVVVPLEALTRAGTYRVDYRVVSTDGHVVVGGYDLTVSASAAAQARQQGRDDGAATKAPSRRDRAASAGAAGGTVAGARAGAATGVAADVAADDAADDAALAARGKSSTDGPPPASEATPIASDPRALAVIGGGALVLVLLLGVPLARRREPAAARSRRTP